MALRFIDSMQHYNSAGIVRKWTGQSFASWNASGGRRNQPFLSGAGVNLFKTLTHQPRYIEGMAIKSKHIFAVLRATFPPQRIAFSIQSSFPNAA